MALDTGSREALLTAREVASWLGVSLSWVMAHASGRRRPCLPSVKLGKTIRFRREAVGQFISDCERFANERAFVQ